MRNNLMTYVYVIRTMLQTIEENMYAKTGEFDTALQGVAAIAKALSHPARLAILRHLAEQKSCYSGDIADELPLSRTTVSQHLQELKRAGLIAGEIEGTRVCYCIDARAFQEMREQLDAFFGELEDLQTLDPSAGGACSVDSAACCVPAYKASIAVCCEPAPAQEGRSDV